MIKKLITLIIVLVPLCAHSQQYKESPILTKMVKNGKLPPISERLPEIPYIAKNDAIISSEFLKMKIGKHGGTMQLPQIGAGGDAHIFIGMNEPLIWAYNAFEYDKGVSGNIAESYEVNDSYTEFTFHLRKGLKWSDGAPVTTEDVRFAFEDVLYNKEVTPAFPVYLRARMSGAGSPAKYEILNKYSFKIIFDEPYGAFIAQMAIGGWRSYVDVLKPSHYLKQFHIKYTSLEELKPLMKKESILEDQWAKLFNAKQLSHTWTATTEGGIGHPTLLPWVITDVQLGSHTFERNPYYWKVDEKGNQLPYIDRIVSHIVQDMETLTARALMGEFDYLGERASLKKLPLMKEAERKGKVKIYMPRMHRTPLGFHLNLTYDDPNWRKVTGDIRFRKALSLAINREQIIKTFYLGKFADLPSEANSPEFNKEKANKLLDEMGMDKKDSSGFRLGPDGKRFRINFEMRDLSEDHLPVSELIAEYWKNVGVYTTTKMIDRGVYGQKVDEIQASGIWPVVDMWMFNAWWDYLPEDYGIRWQKWYRSQGKEGEEPPQNVKELFDVHERLMGSPSGSQESLDLIQEILKLHRDNYWYFIPAERSYYATFFTPRIQNVPTGMSDGLGVVQMHTMEFWYIDE